MFHLVTNPRLTSTQLIWKLKLKHLQLKQTLAAQVSGGAALSQLASGLVPHTGYEILVEMWTFDSLCTRWLPALVTTVSLSVQLPPSVDEVTAGNIWLSWQPPQEANSERKKCRHFGSFSYTRLCVCARTCVYVCASVRVN